jgi:hypothetical protein
MSKLWQKLAYETDFGFSSAFGTGKTKIGFLKPDFYNENCCKS